MIRSATSSDSAPARELVFSILHEFGFTPDPTGTDADLFDVETSYNRRGGAFEVLEDESGAIIGTVGLMPRRTGVCELRKMYLRADCRGRGYGRMLLEHAMRKARKLGFVRIELETEDRLADAIRLYRRFGFIEQVDGCACDRCNRSFALNIDDRV